MLYCKRSFINLLTVSVADAMTNLDLKKQNRRTIRKCRSYIKRSVKKGNAITVTGRGGQ
jgi:hypothetical protein